MPSRKVSLFIATSLFVAFAACSGAGNDDPVPGILDAGSETGNDAGTISEGQDGGSNASIDPRLKPPADLSANPSPQPTEVGFELGEAVKQTIGVAGGTLSYGADGPTIEIPAGALDADVEISIQRISGTAPHARGHAFRFGPDGATFSSPVNVTFPIPPELDGSGAIDGLGVAYQDGEGYWQAISDVSVDAVGRKVVAKLDHFSDWTLFQQLELRPANASLAVNRALGVWVYRCVAEMDPVTFVAPLLPSCKAASGFGNWAVNGIAGGDSTVGAIVPLLYGAGYTAPDKVPAANPVAISVEVPMGDRRKALLVSNVRVIEDQPCSFETPCTWSGSSWWQMTSIKESGTAQVRWVVAEKVEWRKQVRYRPEGKVWHRNDDSGCVPKEQPVDLSAHNDDREPFLWADFSGDEPVYWISDSVATWDDVTITCPSGHTETGKWESYFADGFDMKLSEDGTALVTEPFEDESIGFSSGFRFTRE